MRAGAVRVGSTSLGNGSIETVAFKNPDGSLALVALNSNGGSTLTFKVRWGSQSFDYSLPPRSVVSFKWKPGTSSGGGSTSATYRLVNKWSNKCVDIIGPDANNGTGLHQWTCHTGSSQQWTLEPTDSGYYRLVSRYNGKVLDVGSVSTADGATVQQWDWSNGSNQQFKPVTTTNGYSKLEARHSGKVLDVADCTKAGVGDGARLQQWTWATNNDCQQFRLEAL